MSVATMKRKSAKINHNGRIDIGCGKSKREGFTGIDQYAMDGVDHVFDLRKPWPIESNSVDEAHSSHFIEHLTALERVHFYNELHRVMKSGAKATIIAPHWGSNRAYGDPTHQWPPVSEMSFYYLSKDWRATQAPHTDKQWNPEGYDCNFAATWGYSLRQDVALRNSEFQQFAMQNYKEVITDMVATLTKG